METKADLTFIREVMDRKIDEKNALAVMERLNELSSLVGLSSEVVANCFKAYQNKKGDVIEQSGNANLSPSILKQYIDSECVNEEAEYKLAERYNAGIVHMIDALRSILSYLKSEMNLV